jgi:hypothetical protein
VLLCAISGTGIAARPLSEVITQRCIVALQAIQVGLLAIGVTALLCACTPSDRPAAARQASPVDGSVIAAAVEASRHYGSSTEPRTRHRAAVRHARHRYERQQARAETVNPPFDAGE